MPLPYIHRADLPYPQKKPEPKVDKAVQTDVPKVDRDPSLIYEDHIFSILV
jgi:hypothetical protein